VVNLTLPRLVPALSACLLFFSGAVAIAAGFTASGPEGTVGVLAGFPQGGELIRVTAERGSSLGSATAQSGASWLRATPSENRIGEIDLIFDPRGMSAGNYHTTVTVNLGGDSQAVPVSMQLSASNQIKQIIADPWKSRVYLLADGASDSFQSRVVVLDAVDGGFVREVAAKRAHSMAQSPDGKYLYTMQAGSNAVARIDLQRMRMESEVALPDAIAPNGQNFGSLCAGRGNAVYFLDATVAGKLFAVDLNTRMVIQQIDAPPTAGSSFGRLRLSPDGSRLHASLVGTPTGTQGPFEMLVTYDVGPDGTLTAKAEAERSLLMPPTTTKNAPLSLAAGGELVALGDRVWEPGDFHGTGRTFPSYVRGMSEGGEVVAGDAGIFNGAGIKKLLALPFSVSPQAMAVTKEGHVFYALASEFGFVDPTTSAPEVFPVHPPDGSNGPAPLKFRWKPVDGAREYRVHFSADGAALQPAQVAEGTQTFVSRDHWLENPLSLVRGDIRYWRVDALAPTGIVRGAVISFSVADFGIEARGIEIEMVKNCTAQPLKLAPVPPASGVLHITGGAVPWLKAAGAGGGDFTIDATLMPSSRESTVVSFENGGVTVDVPLTVNLHSCNGGDLIVDPNAPILHALATAKGTAQDTGANFVVRVDAANGNLLDSRYLGRGDMQLSVAADGQHVGIERMRGGFFETSGGVEILKGGDYSRVTEWVSHHGNSNTKLHTGFGPETRMTHAARLIDWRTGEILAKGGSNNGPITVFAPDGSRAYGTAGTGIQSYDMTSATLAPIAFYSDPRANGEDRPAITRDGSLLAWGLTILDANLQVVAKGTDDIRDMSADGKVLVCNGGLYHVPSLRRFGNAPGALQNIEISDLTRTVIRPGQGGTGEELRFIVSSYDSLLTLTGDTITPTTPSGSLVVTDTITLRWSDLTAASGYRVFLGTDEAAVAAAVAGSPLDLGFASSAQWPTAITLEDDKTYYWKVIAEGPYASSSSAVWSFRTPDFSFDKPAMNIVSPAGSPMVTATNSIIAPPGKSWTLSTTTPWIQLPVTSGIGSGSFQVRATATTTTGTRNGSIQVNIGSDVVQVPVSFFSFRYSVRDYVADPGLGVMHVMAIPQLATAGLERVYLIRMDMQTLTPVETLDTALDHQGNGSTVATTRIAVHPQDNRVYLYHSTAGKVLGINRGAYRIASEFNAAQVLGTTAPLAMVPGGQGRLAFGLADGGMGIHDANSGQRLHGTSNDPTLYSVMKASPNADRVYVLSSSPVRPKFFRLTQDAVIEGNIATSATGTFGGDLSVSADGNTIGYRLSIYNRDLESVATMPNLSGPERIMAINADGSLFLVNSLGGAVRWATRSGAEAVLPSFSSPIPKIEWDSSRGKMLYRVTSSSYRWLKQLTPTELPLPAIPASAGWITSGPGDWRETSAGSGVIRTPQLLNPGTSDISSQATLSFKTIVSGTLRFDWRNLTSTGEQIKLIVNGTTTDSRSATTSFVSRIHLIPANSTVQFSYGQPIGSPSTSAVAELRNILFTASAAITVPQEPTADSDGDGASDLLEVAMGSDPAKGGSLPVTEIAPGDDGRMFRYERPAGLPYRYQVQVSDDLMVWVDLAAEEAVERSEGGERVSIPIPAGRAKAFLRLHVTPVQP
jgi:hypothetical protein